MLPENPIELWTYSFMAWWALYLVLLCVIRKVLKDHPMVNSIDKAHIAEGLVSSVKGFFCGGTGIVIVLATRHNISKGKHWFTVPYSTIGSAYFIYDLVAMYISHAMHEDSKRLPWVPHFKLFFKRSTLMIVHHIVLIFFLFPALIYYSNMGDFFTGCFYLTEISTPFVNMRVILSKFGLKSSKLYIINGVLMTVVFAMCRVIMFPYMYLTYLHQHSKGITYLATLAK